MEHQVAIVEPSEHHGGHETHPEAPASMREDIVSREVLVPSRAGGKSGRQRPSDGEGLSGNGAIHSENKRR